MNEICNIHIKRIVAVIPATGQLSVQVYLGKGHDAVAQQIQPFTAILFRNHHPFPVPALPLPGQLPGIAITICDKRAGDGPIMGDAYGLPIRIVKFCLIGKFMMTFRKLPPLTKPGHGSFLGV